MSVTSNPFLPPSSEQLRSDPESLVLLDGTTVTFRFSMRVLAVIEENQGLQALQDSLNGKGAQGTGQIRQIVEFLALGLPPERPLTGDQLLDLIPLGDTKKAIDIMRVLIEKAFPKETPQPTPAPAMTLPPPATWPPVGTMVPDPNSQI